MRGLTTSLQAALQLGPQAALLYARYQVKRRSGWLRWKTPVRSWEDELAAVESPAEPPFSLVPPGHLDDPGFAAAEARRHALAEGRAVLAGTFRLFGALPVKLGFPPPWDRFAPLAGAEGAPAVPLTDHWSHVDLKALPADPKLLWETSRFFWVFTLGRAYVWSADDRFAQGCWQLLESWTTANPPNTGPHWVSAQEVAFRLLALCFARGAFQDWLQADRERRRWLAALVRAHARRIPPTLDYSRAQGNNHLITEGVALYTAGALYPEQEGAEEWRRCGRRWLIAGFQGQIFSDGGYVQHSTNYARLALQLGLWAVRVGELAGEPLPAEITAALRRLASYLGRLADDQTGRAPNFGPNDGTHLLGLTTCGFEDLRPTLQAAGAILGGLPSFAPGPHDELARWLGARSSAEGEPSRRQVSFPQAGLHLSGGQGTQIVVRAVEFTGRPGHADQLHVDLWWHGQNLAMDPGTYLYGGDPPWENSLASAFVHNTVVLDEREPMFPARPFLWLNWTRARLVERVRGEQGQLEVIVVEHELQEPGALRHRRSVLHFGGDHCLVVDDILGSGTHRWLLPWLLPDGDWERLPHGIQLQLPPGRIALRVTAPSAAQALFRAGKRIEGGPLPLERPQWGWCSPTYAQLVPALHWVTAGTGELPLQLRTWWTLGEIGVERPEVTWDEDGPLARIRSLAYEGAVLEL